MEDERRVSGLLELASQHMKRFRELEEIEWKINFSVWALLGGLAYLWAVGKMTPPAWSKSPVMLALAPLTVMVLHGIAIFMLSRQHQQAAKIRNFYREEALKLLMNPKANPPFVHEFKYLAGLRVRDWCWMGWFMCVTFVLAEAVLLLIAIPRNAP